MVSDHATTGVRAARRATNFRKVIPCMHTSAPVAAPARTLPDAAPAPLQPVSFHYTQTDSFVALLAELGASLLISTYQANKLLVARASGAGLSMLVRTF